MPYTSSYASTTLTVVSIGNPILSIDRDKALPGEYVTFTVRPPSGEEDYWAYTTVEVQIRGTDGSWYTIESGSIEPPTYEVSFTWEVPYSIHGNTPCTTWLFRAYSVDFGTVSDTVELTVGYRTRIYGLSVSPSSVAPNKSVTVSGYLQYETSTGWVGLGGQSIAIYIDNTYIGSTTTGSDGSFSLSFNAPSTPGTYTIKAVFTGTYEYGGTEAVVGLGVTTIPTPPTFEIKPEHIALGVGLLTVGLVGTYIALNWDRITRYFKF